MFTTHHISLETTRPSSRWHRYAQVHYRTIGKSEYEGKGRYQACCEGEKGSGVYHSSCHRVHHSTSSTGGPAKARGRLHFMAYPKDGCHMSFARLTFSLSISFIFLFFFFLLGGFGWRERKTSDKMGQHERMSPRRRIQSMCSKRQWDNLEP